MVSFVEKVLNAMVRLVCFYERTKWTDFEADGDEKGKDVNEEGNHVI